MIKQNLSLEVALPARVNKVEREFAAKDLMDGYWVVGEFVKNSFNASTSRQVMASNKIKSMSNLVASLQGDGTILSTEMFGFEFTLIQY